VRTLAQHLAAPRGLGGRQAWREEIEREFARILGSATASAEDPYRGERLAAIAEAQARFVALTAGKYWMDPSWPRELEEWCRKQADEAQADQAIAHARRRGMLDALEVLRSVVNRT
jgi:hypothetical protein